MKKLRIAIFGIGRIGEVHLKNNTAAEKPHLNFFLERYEKSFVDQLDNFVENCLKNRKATVTFEDCRKSLEICEKLYLSVKSGKSIKL